MARDSSTMQINLLIGLGAGLVSAMLFASASTGTVLGLFVLFFLSPMPVAIAGLGWGWRAAAASAFAAAVAIAAVGTPRGAIFHLLAIGAPTAILSYLALLNREVATPDGAVTTEWYPTGRIVAVAALIAGTLAAIGLLATASDVDNLRDQLRATAERVVALSPTLPVPPAPAGTPSAPPAAGSSTVTPEQLTGLANLLASMFTATLANMWMCIAMLNMWLAAVVVRKSDRLSRPWTDLSELRLPSAMPIALAVAIGLTFLPGFAGLIGSGFAAAIIVAYLLVGLAIIHNVTRGHQARPIILAGVYALLLVFFVLTGPALAMVGLAEPFSPLRRKSAPPGTT
jgi:Predicted membrane protein (DUF2232)